MISETATLISEQLGMTNDKRCLARFPIRHQQLNKPYHYIRAACVVKKRHKICVTCDPAAETQSRPVCDEETAAASQSRTNRKDGRD